MQSLNHDFNLRRMERYVTLAWQSGAVPVIVLTKADLVEDCSEQVLASQKVAPGVEVHAISTITGFGLDVLKDYLKPAKRLFFLAHPVLANQVLSMLLQDKRLWLWVIFVKMIRKAATQPLIGSLLCCRAEP